MLAACRGASTTRRRGVKREQAFVLLAGNLLCLQLWCACSVFIEFRERRAAAISVMRRALDVISVATKLETDHVNATLQFFCELRNSVSDILADIFCLDEACQAAARSHQTPYGTHYKQNKNRLRETRPRRAAATPTRRAGRAALPPTRAPPGTGCPRLSRRRA